MHAFVRDIGHREVFRNFKVAKGMYNIQFLINVLK